MRKSKPYAGGNGEQFGVSETRLNYLAGVADDELREISQRSAEYRAVESAKHPKPRRCVIAATGTWVAPYSSQAWVMIILGRDTEPAMLKKELETAKELVAKAGNILLERYQENHSVSWKGIDAPVAAADRAASEFLVRELKRLFPDDGTHC